MSWSENQQMSLFVWRMFQAAVVRSFLRLWIKLEQRWRLQVSISQTMLELGISYQSPDLSWIVTLFWASASISVTWWRTGQLWVARVKVSRLSKQQEVCVTVCVCLISPHWSIACMCVYMCVCVWHGEYSAVFLLLTLHWLVGNVWLNWAAQTLLTHTQSHTSLPVNLLSRTPPWQHIHRYHDNLSVFKLKSLSSDLWHHRWFWQLIGATISVTHDELARC